MGNASLFLRRKGGHNSPARKGGVEYAGNCGTPHPQIRGFPESVGQSKTGFPTDSGKPRICLASQPAARPLLRTGFPQRNCQFGTFHVKRPSPPVCLFHVQHSFSRDGWVFRVFAAKDQKCERSKPVEKGERHRAASVFRQVWHLRRLGASPPFPLHAYSQNHQHSWWHEEGP